MAESDESFFRRIGAVLVAERESDSDAANDAAVTRALASIRAAGGDAERLGARSVVGGFDHAAAAVGAAGAVHADAGAPPDASRAQWRVGIDVGEVIMTMDGEATRAAVERASSLARMARPGTTAIASTALASVTPVRDVSIELLDAPPAPGAPEGGIHLIIPRPTTPSFERRRLLAVLGIAAAGVVGTAVWIVAGRSRFDEEPHPVTLGVGVFRSSRADPEHAWIGEAMRTGLNTQLSELSGVKVYSQPFIDFLESHDKLSEIEVATRLGIQKMLTGSVLVVGESVRVEAQIVDVATGVLEGAYGAVGREQDFLALENDVVVGVISRLRLPLSADDKARLAARRAVDPQAFRRFLDSEGGGAVPAPPTEQPKPHEPTSWRLGPRVAFADDARAEIAGLLEDYRRALEAHDVPRLSAMYLDFRPEQRIFLERYFATVRDLKVGIDDVDVAVSGEEAVVSYTRVDEFVDVPTGLPQRVSLRTTRPLRRMQGKWRFGPVQ